MNDPVEHRHVLWGALVGGPGVKDEHNDVTSDFVYNEVAVDYNAGFVGALAGLFTYFGQGQQPLTSFPPKEPDGQPYYCESKLEQENLERTQVTITLHNLTVHPPHTENTLKARYFFSIKEMFPFGQSVKDIRVQVMYDEQKSSYEGEAKVSGPFAWNPGAGIYYVEIDWAGCDIYGKRDIQIAVITGQDSLWKTHWDPSNDWSRESITSTLALNSHIPVYLGSTKVFGFEPEINTSIKSIIRPQASLPEITTRPVGGNERIRIFWKGHKCNVSVFTITGKLLHESIGQENNVIDLPRGLNGCFLLKVKSSGSVVSRKIILK
jgi:hypothetical protein